MLTAQSEPTFFLRVENEACCYDIFINGVKVLDNGEAGRSRNASIPVSIWVVDGANTIGFRIKPCPEDATFDQTACIKAILQVTNDNSDQTFDIGGLSFEAKKLSSELQGFDDSTPERTLDASTLQESESGSVRIAAPVIESVSDNMVQASQEITFASPYGRWSWQDAEVIADQETAFSELQTAYEKIWQLFNSKDVAALHATLDTHYSDYARATFVEKSEIIEELDYLQYDNSPDFRLFEWQTDGHLLQVTGNGKLARIRDEDDESPLLFLNDEEGIGANMSWWFAKINGEWIPVR